MKAQTYTRRFSALIALLPAAFLSCALLVPLSAQNTSANPFSHVAYIPADGSDLTTIRFEKSRLVKVPVRFKDTNDASSCGKVALRDPGAILCPHTKTESSTTAYEVTYSFIGQPTTSEKSTDGHSTFSIYFRPEELSPKVRKALSEGTLSRFDLARLFTVNTSRETVRRRVIDVQSTFCPGFNYVGGKGTQTNTGCQDDIRYKWVGVPSPYITVSVDPVSGGASAIAAVRKP